MPLTSKFGFIGGGNMAEALIRGLLAGGVQPTALIVSEPAPERADFLKTRYSVRIASDNREVIAKSNVVILAVKPQIWGSVHPYICDIISRDLLFITIMAGVSAATIEAPFVEKIRVTRVMPNTPALVLEGASAICAGHHTLPGDLVLTRKIFELIGKAYVLDEKLLDAVTGLSGSGPAYVLTFLEALSDAGVKQGLPREVALGLAAQTVLGTARLLLESREHPAILREKVTSPGGTTIAGLHVLEQRGFRGAVMDAVEAATLRSMDLGK
jgi:pyrroline-5-carboxylate reductase